MRCLKCGEKIPSGHFFCENCESGMENYPVKPGTPIQLPPRAPKPASNKKKARGKKPLPPEIMVVRQRRSLIALTLAFAVTFIAFLLSAGLALHLMEERDQVDAPASYVNVSRETFNI